MPPEKQIKPVDAVALSLALRALTAGKAFFDVATNSGRARVHASFGLGEPFSSLLSVGLGPL